MTLIVDSDLNGVDPQFTLTCISTGGPATTVTWTRDSTTVTEGTETVLDDPVTAQYTHSLTVTGIYPGMYMCTVANKRPSSSSSSFYVLGIGVLLFGFRVIMLSHIAGAFPPTDVRAVQDGPTSIRVTWTPPSPLGDTTGYRIFFSGEGSSDSVSVNGESSYIILANLESGEIYTISIIATSSHLPSESVMTAPVALGKSLYVVLPAVITQDVHSLHI